MDIDKKKGESFYCNIGLWEGIGNGTQMYSPAGLQIFVMIWVQEDQRKTQSHMTAHMTYWNILEPNLVPVNL